MLPLPAECRAAPVRTPSAGEIHLRGGFRWTTWQRLWCPYTATRAGSDLPLNGRRRFHVFSSTMLQLSFSKPLHTAVCESRLRAFADRRIPQLTAREPSPSPFPRLRHLASSCRNAPPCEEALRPENESASLSLTTKLARRPSARAALVNLCRDYSHVKHDHACAEKNRVSFHSTLSHIPKSSRLSDSARSLARTSG
jgi:hypothetical protein